MPTVHGDSSHSAKRTQWSLCEVDAVTARIIESHRDEDGACTVEVVLQELQQELFIGGEADADARGKSAAMPLPAVLPFTVGEVPTLCAHAKKQSFVTSKLLSAVCCRPLVTIHDLECEICEELDVDTYAALGLGSGLQQLPLAQIYFKVHARTPILPVRSQQVLEYVLYNEEAVSILHSSGDVVDLVLHFFQHYLKTYPREALPRPNLHVASLGLHVENFPSFLFSLREEVGRRPNQLPLCAWRHEVRHAQNNSFYAKVVDGLDGALTTFRGGESLTIKVNMSAADKESCHVPPCLWSRSDGPDGGFDLACHFGRYSSGPAGGADRPAETVTAPERLEAAAVPAIIHRGGRQRRRIAEQAASTGFLAEGGSVRLATADLGLLQPRGFASPEELQPRTPPATELALPPVSSSAAPKAAPQAALQALLHDGARLSPPEAVACLAALPVGATISRQCLRQVFLRLAEATAQQQEETWSSDFFTSQAFIPLPTEGSRCTAVDAFVIAELCTPRSVCWLLLDTASALPAEVNSSTVFDRHLQGAFGESESEAKTLKVLFCNVLGVPEVPSVGCWVAWCQTLRSVLPTHHITQDVTKRFMAIGCDCIEKYFVHELAASPDATVHAIVTQLVAELPAEVACHYLFPMAGRWWRGMDGLFYGGSECFGYDESRFVSEDAPSSSLRTILPLPTVRPHVAVEAVLRRCGVHSAEKDSALALIPRDPPLHLTRSAEGGRWYALLACVAPFFQSFLLAQCRAFYEATMPLLRARLRSISVASGQGKELTYYLRDCHVVVSPSRSSGAYRMRQRLSVRYMEAINLLYFEEKSAFTAAMVADVLCDLFFPLSPGEAFLSTAKKLFSTLMEVVNAFWGLLLPQEGAASIPDQKEMERALADAAATLGVHAYSVDPTKAMSDTAAPLQVAPAPFTDRIHFPYGGSGFARPFWFHRCSTPSAPPQRDRARQQQQQRTRHSTNPLDAWGDVLRAPPSAAEWTDAFFTQLLDYTTVGVAPESAGQRLLEDPAGQEKAEEDHFMAFGRPPPRKRPRETQANTTGEDRHASADSIAAERHVYELLSEQYAATPNVEVVWVNKTAETGAPYDIVVYEKNQRHGEKKDVLFFAEVKSTVSQTKKDFELSIAELLLAARFGERYKIYRVFNAHAIDGAQRKIKVHVHEDLVRLWRTNALTIAGELRIMPVN